MSFISEDDCIDKLWIFVQLLQLPLNELTTHTMSFGFNLLDQHNFIWMKAFKSKHTVQRYVSLRIPYFAVESTL